MSLARLAGDRSGASAVEFVLCVPLFVIAFIGMAQMGVLFLANSGVQHAVGEGARFATIYPNPSDAEIIDKVRSAEFGLVPANITDLTVTRGVNQGADYAEVTLRYAVPLDFVLFEVPPVAIEKSRRVYLP